MDTVEQDVIELRRQHHTTWRDEPEWYWLVRLKEEVDELGASLAGNHEDPPEWELKQIASICINWLEMRSNQLRE